MSRLDKAIADFEDETLDLTLGERLSRFRYAMIDIQFLEIKKVSSGNSDSKETEKIKEVNKWLKEMDKLYTLQIRMNKLTGKSDDSMDREFLERIKDMKSSIGEIVVRIPKPENVSNN